MQRITTFAALSQVASAFLNALQDRASVALPGSKNNAFVGAAVTGFDGFLWMPSAGSLAAGALVWVDTTIDWRDRWCMGSYTTAGSSGSLPGGVGDYDYRTGVFTSPGVFVGYTGTGAVSNITTGAAVAAGAQPIAGAGAYRSYRVEVASNVYLYVDPGDFSLYLYNGTGATIYPLLLVSASGKTGRR